MYKPNWSGSQTQLTFTERKITESVDPVHKISLNDSFTNRIDQILELNSLFTERKITESFDPVHKMSLNDSIANILECVSQKHRKLKYIVDPLKPMELWST